MPIYEYQCPDCGHKFEKLQKITADPITVCPECGGGSVRKLVSASAFILKGSGWYKDHYGLKKSSGKGEEAAASSGKGDGAAAGSAGGDGSGGSKSSSGADAVGGGGASGTSSGGSTGGAASSASTGGA